MILARKAHDAEITAGKDVAFATATGRCAGVDLNGKREELQFRLTMGLGKIDGSGVIHEHHSLPAKQLSCPVFSANDNRNRRCAFSRFYLRCYASD